MNKFREFQEVAHRDYPNPRPVRENPYIPPQAFNLDPIPFHRTLLEAVVFVGCVAAIGLLMIVFGGAA